MDELQTPGDWLQAKAEATQQVTEGTDWETRFLTQPLSSCKTPMKFLPSVCLNLHVCRKGKRDGGGEYYFPEGAVGKFIQLFAEY